MNETNWIPGIIVLVGGLLAGVLFALFGRRSESTEPTRATGTGDATLADLDERYRSLIAQLKELTAEKHQLTEAAFEAEKTRLELEAANVLRLKENAATAKAPPTRAVSSSTAPSPQAPAGFFSRNPVLKGALIGAGVVLFFVGLGVLMAQESTPRGEGQTMTGGPSGAMGAQGSAQGAAQEDPALRAATQRFEQNPDDVEAIARLAHELLERQQFAQAQELTERGSGIDPFHVETRVHRAVLQGVAGNAAKAVSELEHLANTYEGAYEGLLYAGALLAYYGPREKALDFFERYAAEAPEGEVPPNFHQSVERLRNELARAR